MDGGAGAARAQAQARAWARAGQAQVSSKQSVIRAFRGSAHPSILCILACCTCLTLDLRLVSADDLMTGWAHGLASNCLIP